MKELIPLTPEDETTDERFAWDEILRALSALSEYDKELDVFEAINDLKDEELEDGLMMVFNYAVNVMTDDESDDLESVRKLLEENGMIEGWGKEDEI
jgi:hypothetical protein